jgi:hypothetical protein
MQLAPHGGGSAHGGSGPEDGGVGDRARPDGDCTFRDHRCCGGYCHDLDTVAWGLCDAGYINGEWQEVSSASDSHRRGVHEPRTARARPDGHRHVHQPRSGSMGVVTTLLTSPAMGTHPYSSPYHTNHEHQGGFGSESIDRNRHYLFH